MLCECLDLFALCHQPEDLFCKFNVFPNRVYVSLSPDMAKLKPYLQRPEAARILKTTLVEICLLFFLAFEIVIHRVKTKCIGKRRRFLHERASYFQGTV